MLLLASLALLSVVAAWGVAAPHLFADDTVALSVTPGPWIRRTSLFARESALIGGAFLTWQLLVESSPPSGALSRGRALRGLEDRTHLDPESALARALAPIRPFMLGFYGWAQLLGLALAVVLAVVAGRSVYVHLRRVVLTVTLVCVTFAALLPVAPLRMVLGVSGDDPFAEFHGIDQVSAMPSVHVAWAVAIAAVLTRARARTSSAVLWLLAALTCVFVMATLNHDLLDVAAGALVAWAVEGLYSRGRTCPAG
jgi:hypothetical protein